MVIRLTPDIETVLNREAKRHGMTPEQLALDSLGKLFLARETPEAEDGQTLYDALAGHVGFVDGSNEPLSERCGQRAHLARAYGEDEPDYSEADLKPELNR
jgi:hypothetical protein